LGVRTPHDLDGLIRFIGRDDVWRERMADVLDEHVAPAMEEFEVDFEELGEILGESWPMVLWGCAFEDFLGRTYGTDGENIVDLYLKRRGWKETALNRAYIAGLRDAAVSLYEVSEIKRGESMVLRNLLTDEAPVTVREKSATQSLNPWGRIAVRVVPQRDYHVISGALLPFSLEAVDLLIDGMRQTLKLGKRTKLRLSTDQLQRCAPLFANAWLFTYLPKSLDPEPPRITNSEGDELLYHDLRFPLAAGVLQKDVVAGLAKVPAIEPAGPKFWNWLETEAPKGVASIKGIALDQTMSGARVLGTFELTGKALILSVNSARRAELGAALIRKGLGDLLKSPLTAIRTVEQMMAEGRGDRGHRDSEDIPPEIARQIVYDHMDRHYRDTLDQPVPALGGKTPREAVSSAAGRRKVVEWLKLIENRSAGQQGTPLAEYDFGWMWDELGLAGPLLPLATLHIAAVQLSHCCHSCVAQQFLRRDDRRADKAALCV
jgi:hypothetical protein